MQEKSNTVLKALIAVCLVLILVLGAVYVFVIKGGFKQETNIDLALAISIDSSWDEKASPILLKLSSQESEKQNSAQDQVAHYYLVDPRNYQNEPLSMQGLTPGNYRLEAFSPITADATSFEAPEPLNFTVSIDGQVQFDNGETQQADQNPSLKMSFNKKQDQIGLDELNTIKQAFTDAQTSLPEADQKLAQESLLAMENLAQKKEDAQKQAAELEKIEKESKSKFKYVFKGELRYYKDGKSYADFLTQRAQDIESGKHKLDPQQEVKSYVEDLAGSLRELRSQAEIYPEVKDVYLQDVYNTKPKIYCTLLFDHIIKVPVVLYDPPETMEVSRLDLPVYLEKKGGSKVSYKGGIYKDFESIQGKEILIGIKGDLYFYPGDIFTVMYSIETEDAEILWIGDKPGPQNFDLQRSQKIASFRLGACM